MVLQLLLNFQSPTVGWHKSSIEPFLLREPLKSLLETTKTVRLSLVFDTFHFRFWGLQKLGLIFGI